MNKYIRKIITIVLAVMLATTPVSVLASSKKSVNKVIKVAKSKIHCKYVYGASGKNRFDCSGFVYYVYKKSHVKLKKKIPRTSCQSLSKKLKKYKVSNKLKNAKRGDIILYKNGGRYTHTAISLGKGKMIHASSSRGEVCIAKAKNVRHSKVAVIRVIK